MTAEPSTQEDENQVARDLLRAHMNSRVKVPVKQNAFQLVTEGNCVAARRGGEQPEVNGKPVG